MISVDEALARILSAFSPLAPVRLPLADADDLVLAEPVVAPFSLPPFSNSAMDGFAVRVADLRAASAEQSVPLRVIGQSAPGKPFESAVASGDAVRIMTGAMIPSGADAVIRFEDVASGSDPAVASISISRPVELHENVRFAGEDVAAGESVLAAGTLLRAPEIGLLAALDQARVTVHPRPRVAILSTGDELATHGTPLRPGMIYESNSYALAAMVRRFGGVPTMIGIAHDTFADLRQHLAAVTDADLIVTSGGVSVGDYDVVKQVLHSDGEIALWQVRMKPGKPLAFGYLGQAPLLGLPGNPVAAMVAFQQFGRPAIAKLRGRSDFQPPTVTATLIGEPVVNRGERRHFIRARVVADQDGHYLVEPVEGAGAGIMSSLVAANGLLVIPETVTVAQLGDRFTVQLLD